MDTLVTRKKLHTLVDEIPEARLQEVFEILAYAEGEYSDEFKAMLDEEYSDYQLNHSGFTKQQIDEEIRSALYKK